MELANCELRGKALGEGYEGLRKLRCWGRVLVSGCNLGGGREFCSGVLGWVDAWRTYVRRLASRRRTLRFWFVGGYRLSRVVGLVNCELRDKHSVKVMKACLR